VGKSAERPGEPGRILGRHRRPPEVSSIFAVSTTELQPRKASNLLHIPSSRDDAGGGTDRPATHRLAQRPMTAELDVRAG
jgi:hypothetical protein